MLFKSITLAAFAASVVSQEISAADVVSNINRLTTLTRIATSITHFVVYLNNPVEDRLDTIAIIEAIATQGTLDQNFMTGNACGALTKRYPKSIAGRSILEERQSTAFTAEEQTSVTNAYSTLVNVTQSFMAECNEKHYAVVAHNAAHSMGQALNSTLSVLDTMTDTLITMVSAQTDAMKTQKDMLDESYSTTVDLYVNGPV